jgi:hypothetical protein
VPVRRLQLVESQLGQLFRTCGLPEHFKWDAESWVRPAPLPTAPHSLA